MLGFVALMGVAVQTSVILYSFINKLRLEGKDIPTATLEASLLRLRPIMMTALVACFGLLPAAMSTGIGSDSQKPFAIVIVGGLASRLLLSIFLAPVCAAAAPLFRRTSVAVRLSVLSSPASGRQVEAGSTSLC
jgi:cobalt-zinc-cadmium resistance protein CzcA